MTTTELATHVLDLERRVAELEARTDPNRLASTAAKGLMDALKRRRDLDPIGRQPTTPAPQAAQPAR